MAKKEERFVQVYSENFGSQVILVDKVTGVNYLFVQSGYAGGLTPLLNRDGTPVIRMQDIECHHVLFKHAIHLILHIITSCH